MDYQELEAFMRLPPEERERRTVQTLSDVREGVRQLTKVLGSESCPFAACELKKTVDKVNGDVELLKKERRERKETKKTWRDYAMSGGLVVLGGVISAIVGSL